MNRPSPHPTRRSLLGLDVVNVFMADVKDGVGVYLAVYLLIEHGWDSSRVGLVMAIPSVIMILAQAPVGALIDRTRLKRMLLIAASGVVALSCLAVIFFPRFLPIALSQAALGLVQTVFPPCVAAISLGMVGREGLPKRIGRNESFNHAGNMLAAVAAIGLSGLLSYQGIFYFSIFQCLAIVAATAMIREGDIDHDRARETAEVDGLRVADAGGLSAGLRTLFSKPEICWFTAAIFLWNVANGAMLPLLGQKLGLVQGKHSALELSVCITIAQAVMIVVAPLAARPEASIQRHLFLLAFVLVPIRAALFAWVPNPALLIGFQVLDGLGAGIYGVLSILTMAELGRGSGHFNLLQGTTYAAIGLGVALSNLLSGYVVRGSGYSAAFLTLAGIGCLATAVFSFFTGALHFPHRSVPQQT